MEWEKIAIGHKSVCEINPSDNYQKNKEYLFVPMDAVGDDLAGLKYLDKRIIENGGLVSFREGDTLVAKITPCAENGKIAFIKSLEEDIGFGSTEFIVFRPNTENITSAFLYYLLSSHRIHGLAISLMEGTTGRQRIPVNAYKKRIIVQIPPLPEQKTIAAILSKVDEAIAAVEDSIKAAEKVKKALMQNLLTGKLKPDGTWRSEDEFYTDEKFGNIPKGWEIKKLGSLGEFMNGVNFSSGQVGRGTPFINLKDIYANKIIDCQKLERVEINNILKLKLTKGDILFVRSWLFWINSKNCIIKYIV
jgi:type I restriction enzyme S subunit